MSPGSRRTSGAVTRAHMTKQQKAIAQDAPASSRRRTKSPPLPLIGADQSAPNPHCITTSPITSSASVSFPPPPDTPPPLVDAYQSSQPPESVSGRSSSRSSPEISSYAPTYPSTSAPHSAARVSHSPEASYAASPRHPVIQYAQSADAYAYPDAEQAPSPASSSGGHLSSQPHSAHPVSPQSPYGYPAHYGMQHNSVSQVPSGMSAARTSGKFMLSSVRVYFMY